MCGGGGGLLGGLMGAIFGEPDTPQVVQRDVAAEQKTAEDEATKKANASRAALKRSRTGGTSLLATGAGGVGGTAETSSVLATGKTTLGQ